MNPGQKRLRLLLSTDTIGGTWQYTTELARALGPLGIDTILAVLGPAPDAAQRAAARAIDGMTLVETGLPLDWLAETPAEVAAAGAQIAALATSAGAHLAQLNQPSLAAHGGFAIPVVAVSHSCVATWWDAMETGPLPADFAWRAALHGAGLRAADRVVAPSAAFAAATQAAYALAERPTTVFNGRTPLHNAPAPMHDFAFTAGRLWDRGKNLATLDRAAARLGVPFKAAGALAGPNGECVTFDNLHALGSLGEAALAQCLASRPVFVSAARYEPFGLAVLEAAAAGCPLVLADIPTFRELWGHAATFVACDDDRGFAEAIDALIGDAGLRLAQGEKARAAASRFAPERMAGEMNRLYRQILRMPAAVRVAA